MQHNIPRLLVFSLLVLSTLPARAARPQTPVPSQTGAGYDQDAIRQIVELERASKDAILHRDAGFSERTLADDYVAISPLGQIINKSETVNARKSGQLKYESFDITDMVVRVYGNTAVVTARADVRGRDLGEDFGGPYRFTRVWVRRNGHWQTVSYQATVTR
jgi:ketosteroid isomerase-like protein